MSTKSPCQFPDSLHRVQLGAIGRQEVESNAVTVLFQPWRKRFRMMPPGIVDDDNHESVPAPMTKELLKEQEKRGSIEFLIQSSDKTSVGVTDSPENADALSSRCMKYDRIGILWRNPHGAS